MTEPLLLAEVVLKLESPAAVAAPEQHDGLYATVREVARDGWSDSGAPWVPPSSLAGSFRTHLRAAAGEETERLVMGYEEERSTQGRPSSVRFLGTHLREPAVAPRTRTAVDPYRAAAATGLLHTHELLQPGCLITCWIQVDAPEHHRTVLDHLATWNPVIGGGRSTGHGTTTTVSLRSAVLDLSTQEGRRLWLTHGGPALFEAAGLEPIDLEQAKTGPKAGTATVLPALTWCVVDALHIGNGTRAAAAPTADGAAGPQVALLLRDHDGTPYVPGTAWKGLLRHRTAYILRSTGHEACPGTADTCGTCSVCETFGWTGEDGQGARGLLRLPDTPLQGATVVQRQHVALDRFTGGAAEGLLYSEEVAESGTLTLTIGSDRDPGTLPAPAVAALTLALRDLHDGLIGIGKGVTRGQGTLRCTQPEVLDGLVPEARATLTRSIPAGATA
ncbi:RAMP superfamily CRISPR-associated protein [Streptomyces sp. NPDC012403]|uniref:RAMP superfamily CRISPR-associated protein n=1 Tax=Streptomyces sp. NPDC012403 TaxID=3364831 RepID=UPI0036EB03C4